MTAFKRIPVSSLKGYFTSACRRRSLTSAAIDKKLTRNEAITESEMRRIIEELVTIDTIDKKELDDLKLYYGPELTQFKNVYAMPVYLNFAQFMNEQIAEIAHKEQIHLQNLESRQEIDKEAEGALDNEFGYINTLILEQQRYPKFEILDLSNDDYPDNNAVLKTLFDNLKIDITKLIAKSQVSPHELLPLEVIHLYMYYTVRNTLGLSIPPFNFYYLVDTLIEYKWLSNLSYVICLNVKDESNALVTFADILNMLSDIILPKLSNEFEAVEFIKKLYIDLNKLEISNQIQSQIFQEILFSNSGEILDMFKVNDHYELMDVLNGTISIEKHFENLEELNDFETISAEIKSRYTPLLKNLPKDYVDTRIYLTELSSLFRNTAGGSKEKVFDNVKTFLATIKNTHKYIPIQHISKTVYNGARKANVSLGDNYIALFR